MLSKNELIEEIKLFGKLDVKYILEVLAKSYKISFDSKEIVVLDNKTIEIILQDFIFLIESDDEFAKEFQKALDISEEQNKVADTSIEDKEISISKDVLDYIKEIVKKINLIINQTHFGSGDNVAGDKVSYNNDTVEIDGSNLGNIITGNHNTIINESDIDYEKKLKDIVDNLPLGNIVFNAPKDIFYNESKKVTLRISKDIINIDDLTKENLQIEQEVKISSFMLAKLMSFDFEIMALSSEEQVIDSNDFTEWLWDITPNIQKDRGKLYLRITVRIPLSSKKEERKDLPIFEKNINILVK